MNFGLLKAFMSLVREQRKQQTEKVHGSKEKLSLQHHFASHLPSLIPEDNTPNPYEQELMLPICIILFCNLFLMHLNDKRTLSK